MKQTKKSHSGVGNDDKEWHTFQFTGDTAASVAKLKKAGFSLSKLLKPDMVKTINAKAQELP